MPHINIKTIEHTISSPIAVVTFDEIDTDHCRFGGVSTKARRQDGK